MSLPDAVVFDNDGTLLDTEDAWTRAEVALFARRGREFTAEDKRTLLGTSPQRAAELLSEMLGEDDGPALVSELYAIVMDEARAGVPPRPGARELVEALQAAGVPIGVASNSARPFLELVLDAAGWLDGTFAVVLSATDPSVTTPKPAPDIYLQACAALGGEPARCVALEDSPTGVAAAVAAGMRTIGVPYFPGTELPGAALVAEALDDAVVLSALGLDGHAP